VLVRKRGSSSPGDRLAQYLTAWPPGNARQVIPVGKVVATAGMRRMPFRSALPDATWEEGVIALRGTANTHIVMTVKGDSGNSSKKIVAGAIAGLKVIRPKGGR